MGTVVCGGSRSLSDAGLTACIYLAGGLLDKGHSISVGCAIGADLTFANMYTRYAPERLQVFAVGSQFGSGFPAGKASFLPVRAAAAAGAAVVWSAGGIDNVPITARLAVRAAAAVAAADTAAVFVVGSPHSRGSLVAAGVAARRGLPVFFFCDDFPIQALPELPSKYKDVNMPGSWVSTSAFGPLPGLPCVQWLPAPVKPKINPAQQPLF